jgi:hypothetical protein
MTLEGQIFGNRKVIKDTCSEQDWISIGIKLPKKQKTYVLTQCLECGMILPCQRINLYKNTPKRCIFCSNIGNHSNIKTNTNSWVKYEDYAVCNVLYGKEVVSFYIDSEDYESVSSRIWRIAQKRRKYYVITGSPKSHTAIYLHNFIIGDAPDGKEVDHIDGNSLNNRRNNLRFVTHLENIDNLRATRIDNQIGIRGIAYCKRDKLYKVDFNYHNKRVYSKSWNTIEEAVWYRYCLEDYFNLPAIKNNPIAQQYFTLNDIQKAEIKEYALSRIENTWKQAV